MTKLDWNRPGPVRRSAPQISMRVSGIRNEQARELAQLQRQAGEVYSGAGMTARDAAHHIRRLKHQLGQR